MANPNPEIWGASNTWIDAPYAGGATGSLAENLKIHTPKCADFGTESNKTQLRSGITSGRITANEPIDMTICPCGQDETVSAFGRLAIFNEDKTLSITPRIVERTGPVNWCFADLITDTLKVPNSFSIFHDYKYSFNAGMRFEQWSPNAVNTDGYNNNYYLSPYTFYYTRSILLSIEVQCVTAETSTEIATKWRTLDDWKNSHNTEYICGVRCVNRAVNSYSDDTISYITSTIAQYRYSGKTVILDAIPNIDNNGTPTDTTFYSFISADDRGRYSYLFKDVKDITTNRLAIMPAWEMFDGQTINIVGDNSNGYTYYYKIPYSETNYETVMKMVACFGCYFTPTSKTSFAYAMTDSDLCLPVIDENGVAHGEYTRGADNANNDLYELDSIREKDYDPTKPPTPIDPNTYSNITGFNSISAGASATERYVLDAGNTRQLLSDLWTISHDIAGLDYENYDYKILDSFLVTNPIDCIISLKRFPFSIPHTFSSAKTAVNLGKNHGSAEGYLTYNVFNTVQFAGINIFPRFGNSFLDYAPYTEYELYVPFCGTVKLNAGDILGHTLNCRLQIDLITGACTAYIMADSLVIETMTGTVSCELALTGIDSATIDANIQNSVLNHVNARTNKETSMLSPLSIGGLGSAALNPFKTAGNITTAKTELQRAEYELTHIQTQPHTMGTAGGLTGWYQEFNARLMIYYPEGDVITSAQPPELKNLASYGHTTGFATIDNTALSNYSGFTVATNAILNFAATTTEKDMIESALNNGIFI